MSVVITPRSEVIFSFAGSTINLNLDTTNRLKIRKIAQFMLFCPGFKQKELYHPGTLFPQRLSLYPSLAHGQGYMGKGMAENLVTKVEILEQTSFPLLISSQIYLSRDMLY